MPVQSSGLFDHERGIILLLGLAIFTVFLGNYLQIHPQLPDHGVLFTLGGFLRSL